MDVYSQKEQRAHGTGFVGIEAESDDQIDNLEVYEALINPREAERGGAGQNGPGMMPPMMGMGGGGAGATGAGAGGMNTSMATAANSADTSPSSCSSTPRSSSCWITLRLCSSSKKLWIS